MQNSMLATSYPGGAVAVFSGLAGVAVFGVCSVVALIGLLLAPFPRTASVALWLGSVGLCGGLVAFALVLTSTVFIALRDDSVPRMHWVYVRDSLAMLALVGLVPLVGLGARYWSARTGRKRRGGHAA
jgi:uncharacterized membrane protein